MENKKLININFTLEKTDEGVNYQLNGDVSNELINTAGGKMFMNFLEGLKIASRNKIETKTLGDADGDDSVVDEGRILEDKWTRR